MRNIVGMTWLEVLARKVLNQKSKVNLLFRREALPLEVARELREAEVV